MAYDDTLPFCHASIIKTLQAGFFLTDTPLVIIRDEDFALSYNAKTECDERELPNAMVAMTATAVLSFIDPFILCLTNTLPFSGCR